MAMSSVVLAVIVWTSLQFGSEFSQSLSNAEAFAMFRLPVSLQSFVGWYHHPMNDKLGGLQLLELRDIDSKISNSVAFGGDCVDRLERLEANLDTNGVKVQQGTPMHGQLIDSYPLTEALHHGRDSLVAIKASLHLMHSVCLESGLADEQCARYITSLKLPMAENGSEEDSVEAVHKLLGDKCMAYHGTSLSCSKSTKYRSVNGSCNHLIHPSWGQAFTSYRRLLFPEYSDGIQQPREHAIGLPKNKHNLLPSARLVSSSLALDGDLPDNIKTLAVMQWTQFVEHDLAHTPVNKMYNKFESSIMCCKPDGRHLSPRYVHPACMPISIAHNDPVYSSRRMTCMNYVRSVTAMRSDCSFGPAEQMNQATHYLDGSMIYGSTDNKAAKLRLFRHGHLKNTAKNGQTFLPSAEDPSIQCQLDPNSQACYESGDSRVNAHPHLTVMHTIWLREHNRIADKLAELNPTWDDERLFQEARRIVIAEIQHITYDEWLPLVLGEKYTKKFGLTSKKDGFSKEYSENVDPSITNSFATAALRFVHSLMEGKLRLVKEDREVNHTIQLRDHFNRPRIVEENNHLDALVRGLATQNSQKNDMTYTEDITSLLYQDSENYGLDIISLDVQRGRDHGLPGYNQFRKICGLPVATSFNDFKEIPKAIVQKLKSMYKHPDDVDMLIGGMSEKPKDDSLLGPTFRCIIGEQFGRTKKGDRFFYDLKGQSGSFSEDQLQEIRKVTLARILCDNAEVEKMQPSVFHKPSSSNRLEYCTDDTKIPKMNFSFWAEEADSS
ncbi:peroxidase isoform X2 [Anabrus simplex]